MQPNTFYNKAHRDQYLAWIIERIQSGEMARTLHERGMDEQKPIPQMPHVIAKIENFIGDTVKLRHQFEQYAVVLEQALDLIGDDTGEFSQDLKKVQVRIIASVRHCLDIENQLIHAQEETQP